MPTTKQRKLDKRQEETPETVQQEISTLEAQIQALEVQRKERKERKRVLDAEVLRQRHEQSGMLVEAYGFWGYPDEVLRRWLEWGELLFREPIARTWFTGPSQAWEADAASLVRRFYDAIDGSARGAQNGRPSA